jgi:hypothetical protein
MDRGGFFHTEDSFYMAAIGWSVQSTVKKGNPKLIFLLKKPTVGVMSEWTLGQQIKMLPKNLFTHF